MHMSYDAYIVYYIYTLYIDTYIMSFYIVWSCMVMMYHQILIGSSSIPRHTLAKMGMDQFGSRPGPKGSPDKMGADVFSGRDPPSDKTGVESF